MVRRLVQVLFLERQVFEKLGAMPQDAILKVIEDYSADKRSNKIDLGVGVYRDETGATPILSSVKKAERKLLESQTTKSYLGSSGDPDFNQQMQHLVFGSKSGSGDRITTLQTPGGSGSLRIAAGIVLRTGSASAIWTGSPTWANHVPLLGSAGIEIKSYPYYDAESKTLQFDDMLGALQAVPAGDIVLLHGCCHNPTGLDLSEQQWREVSDVIAQRGIVPFIDIAYQGFASGIQIDNFGVRHLFDAVPEMLVASSCSKNFALYRDRVGALSVVSKDAKTAQIVRSQANNIVRTMYSMPPDHGGAVVKLILADAALRSEWESEVESMRLRLRSMRERLGGAMRELTPDHDFSHFERGNGMFSFVGVTPEQVERLKTEFAVYMVASSRINIAGITNNNVDHLAQSIAAVL